MPLRVFVLVGLWLFFSLPQETSRNEADGASRGLGLVIFLKRKSWVSLTEVNNVCCSKCSETSTGVFKLSLILALFDFF